MPVEIPWGLEDENAGAASKLPYLPLYLTGLGDDYVAIVSEEDFQWASQWKWQAHKNKSGKIYARRNTTFKGRGVSVFLHKEICLRSRGLPPSPSHIVADHCNGNSLDCRRKTYYGWQLRWATPRENRQNYNGIYAMQLRMDFKGGKGANRLLVSQTYRGNHVHG